uniref:RNA-directed RNA polymerase n=1 Tax=Riboviria sp. TaxID=2585031 RepID=A0A8K1U217_9VIRU|nr:MAG: hypothetical protein 2 [Riboviria sp.]
MQYEHFYRVVQDLEFTSSPGYPYCRQQPTIGQWLEWDGLSFSGFRLQELWADVQSFLSGDLESLYRVFVKREPVSERKRLEGRHRLIICPPLYEQVAWSMVFGTGNDVQIRHWLNCPSQQGITLCGGLWKKAVELYSAMGYDCGMDKTAWDWTAHIAFLQMDLELRRRLIQDDETNKIRWSLLAKRLYEGAFYHPKLILSNGSVYEQMEPGIMKSGCVNTISTNSHMQIFAHVLGCIREGLSIHPLPVAVGDDTLSARFNTPSITTMESFGMVIKGVVDKREFVGHLFPWQLGSVGPVPVYHAKHLFRFIEVEEEHLGEYLDSMSRLYAHSPEFQQLWRGLAYKLGVSLPSESYVRFWYDFPDDLVGVGPRWFGR